MSSTKRAILPLAFLLAVAGCQHPQITAVSLTCPDEREGIPFYLPKPLLIISKNFRNIETPTVGLTDTAPIPDAYDDQAKYADVNARTNFAGLNTPAEAGGENQTGTPGEAKGTATKSAPILHTANGAPINPNNAPSDGLSPNTFYTYQIIFVPDMSQKYGLKVKGGVGEIRAAMNLVNGWQFTGLGPYYMKDSSTAQNILSSGIATRLGGQAVADVLNSAANLAKAVPPGGTTQAGTRQVQEMARALAALPTGCEPMKIPAFAEIHVFEPSLLPDGRMEWSEIANLAFNRDYLGAEAAKATEATEEVPHPNAPNEDAHAGLQSGTIRRGATSSGTLQAGTVDPEMARMVVARTLGIPSGSSALNPGLQAGEAPTETVAKPRVTKEFNFLRIGGHSGHHLKNKKRGSITTRFVTGLDNIRSSVSGTPSTGGIQRPETQPESEPAPVPDSGS